MSAGLRTPHWLGRVALAAGWLVACGGCGCGSSEPATDTRPLPVQRFPNVHETAKKSKRPATEKGGPVDRVKS